MKLFITLVTLALVFIQQVLGDFDVTALWSPGVNITHFEATLIVPTNPGSTPPICIQNTFAAGLVQSANKDLWVNEVTSSHGNGTWQVQSVLNSRDSGLSPLNGTAETWKDQSVKSVFTKNTTTGIWLDSTVVTSNPTLNAPVYVGSFSEDPATTSENNAYVAAIIGAQLIGPDNAWNLVYLKWKNIIITAETNDTTWCTPKFTGFGNVTANWAKPNPQLDAHSNSVTCYIEEFFIYQQS